MIRYRTESGYVTRSRRKRVPSIPISKPRLPQKSADGTLLGSKQTPTSSGTTPTGKKAKHKKVPSAEVFAIPGSCPTLDEEDVAEVVAQGNKRVDRLANKLRKTESAYEELRLENFELKSTVASLKAQLECKSTESQSIENSETAAAGDDQLSAAKKAVAQTMLDYGKDSSNSEGRKDSFHFATASHLPSASVSQTATTKRENPTMVSQIKQEKTAQSREGTVSSSSAIPVSLNPCLKTSPQPSVNRAAKLSNAAQPREISIDKIKERLIPSKLKESISRLCDKKNVRSYSLMQNPKNPRQIAIMGAEEGQLVSADLEKLQTGDFSDYKLTAPPGRKRVYTKQLVWRNALKLERFDHQVAKTCEFVVKAESAFDMPERLFVVGAAHLMFTEERNLELMDGIGLDNLQIITSATPQRRVVHFRHGAVNERNPEIQEEEEADQTLSSTNHPPLISYRYFYQRQEDNADQFQLLLDATRNGEVAVFQPDEQAAKIPENQCRNDMILCPINPEQAMCLQQQLQNYRPSRREHLVELKNINQLLSYTTPLLFNKEIRIAVKSFVGQLCDNFLTGPDQQEFGNGYHLLFTLDEGELVDGDSGSIVFEVQDNGEHHLLGMLVGRVDTEDIFPDDPEVYYEAIILNLALKDIENHYDVTNLRPFTIG